MAELWWAEASKRDLCPSPLPFTGGPAKGLLHTTEGASYTGALNAYRANNSWPHFTLSFEGGVFHAYQHVPLDRAARSLRNAAGGPETNRDHVIQAEVVGFAVSADKFDRRYLDGIRRWMRWVEANAGVRRGAVAFKAYPASYGTTNGVRMTGGQWDAFDGWCGHQHAPENTHGDPGAIDILYLLDLGPKPTAPWEADLPKPTDFTSACLDPVTGGHWEQTAEGGVAGHDGAFVHGSYKDHPDLGGNVRYFTAIIPSGKGGYVQISNDGKRYQWDPKS